MISKDIDCLTALRYKGYLDTPFLWKESLLDLVQFSHKFNVESFKGINPSERLRLGNYIERFVSFQLHQDSTIRVVLENFQLITNKQTLGEIDCLFTHDECLYHLEIAYKFYLYKPDAGDTFLEHWVGPNLRDSLLKKIFKVKSKQFPLLYSKEGERLLNKFDLDFMNLKQQCFFKGQLFLPYNFSNLEFEYLNKNCVAGFYISLDAFSAFRNSSFYIPKKLDWLVTPIKSVEWITYDEALKQIESFHKRKSAPLLWKKTPKNKLEKVFVTWW